MRWNNSFDSKKEKTWWSDRGKNRVYMPTISEAYVALLLIALTIMKQRTTAIKKRQ